MNNADHEKQADTANERIRRQDKRGAGLAHAAKVDEDEDGDEEDVDPHAMRVEGGPHSDQRGDARCHRHGNGGEVVDHECRCRREPGVDPEVLLGDRERTPTARIRVDRLAVRSRDNAEQQRDRERNREIEARSGDAGQQQNVENLVRPIRNGREGVETKGTHRARDGEALRLRRRRREGTPQNDAPERRDQRLMRATCR